MRPLVLFSIAAVVTIALITVAEAQDNSNHGSAYPSASQLGPNFPKGVSSTQSNPANWAVSPTEYSETSANRQHQYQYQRLWRSWREWR
jgi:hypothetical protein